MSSFSNVLKRVVLFNLQFIFCYQSPCCWKKLDEEQFSVMIAFYTPSISNHLSVLKQSEWEHEQICCSIHGRFSFWAEYFLSCLWPHSKPLTDSSLYLCARIAQLKRTQTKWLPFQLLLTQIWGIVLKFRWIKYAGNRGHFSKGWT